MDIRARRLIEAPLVPTLVRMAVPNILVMLVQMLSAGGIGGGIQSVVSRALGAGRPADAGLLVWHVTALGLGLGIATSLLALPLGPSLYRLMGGTSGSLQAAIAYANVVFGGAILIWLFNALSAVIRGTGNMALPIIVTCAGAVVLIPLSPALIFGWGPFPELGVVGGGVAFAAYYAAGSAVFAAYLWSGRGMLHPSRRLPRLAWAPSREILRIGLLSGIASMISNVTVSRQQCQGFRGRAGDETMSGTRSGWRRGELGLRAVLAAVFLVAGGMKLLAAEFEVAGFARFGYAPWFMYAVGVAQLVGAILLWVRGTVAYGAVFLAVLMVGGVVSHLRAGDPLLLPLPALMLLGLLCFLAYARRGEFVGWSG